MTAERNGVQLKANQSAAGMLHALLRDAIDHYPDVFAATPLSEDLNAFRKHYVDFLPRFEVARIASDHRGAIAQQLAKGLASSIEYHQDGQVWSLSEYLTQPCQPLPLQTASPNSAPRCKPVLSYRGQVDHNLKKMGDALLERRFINHAAANALQWLADHALTDGLLDLSSKRVVVMGANAEMAPTQMFLEAGAHVLWLDIAPPPESLIQSAARAGQLTWASGGADLLMQPANILATIRDFTVDQPAELCLYAYAPGQARELRLTAAMNAIVTALPFEHVGTVTLLLSPTTATPLYPVDIEDLQTRRQSRPFWEALLDALKLLGSGGGYAGQDDLGASRTIVGIQGASYQAAQYIGKIMTAESWSAPVSDHSSLLPLRVSANTAAITQTRSLNHPVFDAAFGGAAALQVETLTPEQSQSLNGLLAVHDWLHPNAPIPASIRVHGGIHTLPYPLNTALRIAAAIGFIKSPGLLGNLLRQR